MFTLSINSLFSTSGGELFRHLLEKSIFLEFPALNFSFHFSAQDEIFCKALTSILSRIFSRNQKCCVICKYHYLTFNIITNICYVIKKEVVQAVSLAAPSLNICLQAPLFLHGDSGGRSLRDER